MSYDPSDHVTDHDDVICGCGIAFDYTTTLRVCAQPGCDEPICSDCLVRCECCPYSFCAVHISDTADGVKACPRCEMNDMLAEELLEREFVERTALVARLRSGPAYVSDAVIAQAVIKHAQEVRL